jgi:NAD(P)-dependent dehydrogenase (short-subunit alcohol dehydrogenase family)
VPKHRFDVNLRRDPERKWGQGLFISSESALNTPKEMVHYGMTKTAQLAVSRGRAESCAGTGVYGKVNAILPEPTHSAGLEDFVTQLASHQSFETFKKEFFKTVGPSSLIKRFETTDEVARLVTFVCSPVA